MNDFFKNVIAIQEKINQVIDSICLEQRLHVDFTYMHYQYDMCCIVFKYINPHSGGNVKSKEYLKYM